MSTDAIQDFLDTKVAHRLLREKDAEVKQWLSLKGSPYIIFVFGPTGSGKTTLARKLASDLNKAADAEHNRAIYPGFYYSFPAVPGFQGKPYPWPEVLRQMLIQIGEPQVDRKVAFADLFEDPNRPGPPPAVRHSKPNLATLFLAFGNALLQRKTQTVFWDEYHKVIRKLHLPLIKQEVDALQSLVELSKSKMVIFGTYSILDIIDTANWSDQIARRSVKVHLPRYGLSKEDVTDFTDVLEEFAERLPISHTTDLSVEREWFYDGCAGCVGVLKEWFDRTLQIAAQRKTLITKELFVETRLEAELLERIHGEINAGERRLSPKRGETDSKPSGHVDQDSAKKRKSKPGTAKPQRFPTGQK